MVFFTEKFSHSLKLPSRLENNKHKTEAILASFQTFHSKISDSLNNLGKESEIMSLEFVKQCFGLFPLMNKAFAKLVLELDCPVFKRDEYLNHSLHMLELLNSASSCLSYMSQDRLSLLHASRLAEDSPARAAKYLIKIKPKEIGMKFKVEDVKEDQERKKNSDKERVIQEALMVMKRISLWVFGVLLSGLCSDEKPYIEVRKMVGRFDDPLFGNLDSKVEKEILGKKGEVKEVKDVNIAVNGVLGVLGTRKSEVAVKELKSRLEVLEKLLHGLEKEMNDLFGEILATRNNLLDSFRLTNKSICD